MTKPKNDHERGMQRTELGRSAWMGLDAITGRGGYRGSPAEREDRALGIKVGGRARWLVTGDPLTGTITKIEIDADGDPWFHLAFPDSGHKDVRVGRSDIAEAGEASAETYNEFALERAAEELWNAIGYCNFNGENNPFRDAAARTDAGEPGYKLAGYVLSVREFARRAIAAYDENLRDWQKR